MRVRDPRLAALVAVSLLLSGFAEAPPSAGGASTKVPLPPDVRVWGTVVDWNNGQPVVGVPVAAHADRRVAPAAPSRQAITASDADISAWGEGQPEFRHLRTDSQGRFTIPGVCPGPIFIHASSRAPKSLPGGARAEGGAVNVRITVSKWDLPSIAPD
ncbi:MAG: hypothetical protein MUC88_09865 [Planctomycetes bacterium]|jgi:hypothetical protein|nr:hypothetical protein [Planctomycetota bacterium]